MLRLRVIIIVTQLYDLIHGVSATQNEIETIQISHPEKDEQIRKIEQTCYRIGEQFGAVNIMPTILTPSNALEAQYGSGQSKVKTLNEITSLRYDLTVQLAHLIQVQWPKQKTTIMSSGPVFRNEIEDYNHFSEFHQFEFDIWNPDSLSASAQILEFACNVLDALSVENYTIRINHRGIVWYMAKLLNIDHIKFQNMLDVFNKATNEQNSIENFISVLKAIPISESISTKLLSLLTFSNMFKHSSLAAIKAVINYYQQEQEILPALTELKKIIKFLPADILSHLVFDPTLARGANYYDGFIFEIFIPNTSIGAIFGGGKFMITDSLTGNKTIGVGGAFGLERLYLVLDKTGQFIPHKRGVALIGEDMAQILQFARELRKQGYNVSTFKDANGIANDRYELMVKIFQVPQNSTKFEIIIRYAACSDPLSLISSLVPPRALSPITA